MSEKMRAIHVSVWFFGIALLFDITFVLLLPAPQAHADSEPFYCYSTQQFIPWPDFSGYCPDGEAPFNGPGPSYGGGNHRWPSGEDG